MRFMQNICVLCNIYVFYATLMHVMINSERILGLGGERIFRNCTFYEFYVLDNVYWIMCTYLEVPDPPPASEPHGGGTATAAAAATTAEEFPAASSPPPITPRDEISRSGNPSLQPVIPAIG